MCSTKMPSLPAERSIGSLCSRDLILKLLHIKMPSLPANRSSGSLCSRDLILNLLHINSSIPSKLLCEIIICFTKLPISQFFDEFSNVAKCFLHMTTTASFPVSLPSIDDGSHDFLHFLMFCQNFLGDLFQKALAMA